MTDPGNPTYAPEVDFRRMMDSFADTAILAVDAGGVIRALSEGGVHMTGYSEAELLGRPVSILCEEPGAEETAQAELRAAAADGRFEDDSWRVRKNGERFWAHVMVQQLEAGAAGAGGFAVVFRDITESRMQQDQLRIAGVLLESLTDYSVILLDDQGRIRSWNSAAEKVFGYAADEVDGRDITLFLAHADKDEDAAKSHMETALDSGRFETEGWRVRKNGDRFWANTVLTPAREKDGRHVGFVKVTRDITERVERERLLKRQRDDILELSTPVIQVWDRVLVLPIIGTLDSTRAARLTENLLERIAADEAAVVILDISGVPIIDTAVAHHLFKTIQGARLMGAESVISGVRPETAQAMVNLGIDTNAIRSRSTLRDALQLALALVGQRSGMDEPGSVNGGSAGRNGEPALGQVSP